VCSSDLCCEIRVRERVDRVCSQKKKKKKKNQNIYENIDILRKLYKN
jgi:hypothetical protein